MGSLGLEPGLWLYPCLVHQHDGNVVSHGIYTVALRTLQALGILPVLQRLFTRGADQDFQ